MSNEQLTSEQVIAKKKKVHNAWTMATSNYAEYIEPHFAPLNKIILDEINQDVVMCLDIASGAGQPALSIADKFNKSKVIGIDLVESMVNLASKRAKEKNRNNCTFEVGDAENLSKFKDNEVDVVTCRQGLGFFPQPDIALKEFLRVLKNKGKLIMTVWGKEDSAILPKLAGAVVNKHFTIEKDPNQKPIWYWSNETLLNEALRNVGFKEINIKQINVDLTYNKLDELFEALRGTPQRIVLEQADEELNIKLKESLKELASKYNKESKYILPCSFTIATAIK